MALTPEEMAELQALAVELGYSTPAPEPQAKPKPMGFGQAYPTVATDIVSFGTGDELAARLDALRGLGTYEERLRFHQANLARAQENTAANILGGITGGVLQAGVAAPLAAMTLPAKVVQGAKNIAMARPAATAGVLGAGGANLYSIGSATEDDPYGAGDIAISTALGGGLGILGANIGGAISKKLSGVGKKAPPQAVVNEIGDVVNVTDAGDVVRQGGVLAAQPAQGQLSPTVQGAVLPMTKGQRTGDVKLLREENLAAQGLLSPELEASMINLRQRQMQGTQGVLGGLGASDDLFEGTQKVQGVLGEQYKSAKAATDAAYKRARELGGNVNLTAGEVAPLKAGIAEALKPYQGNIKVGDALKTKAMLTNLESITKGKIVKLPDLYAFRQSLTGAVSDAMSTDKKAASEMLKAFDGYMEGTLAEALKRGDEGIIDAHYAAIGKYKDMANRFLNDDTIKAIATDPNNTVEQVGNAIFGGPAALGKTNTGEVVGSILKAVEGNDVATRQVKESLRASFATRLLHKGIDAEADVFKPQTIASNIDNLLRNQPTAIKQIFSDAEITKLKALSSDLKSIAQQYKAGVYNPSGTAPALLRTLARGMRWTGPAADMLDATARSIATSGPKARVEKSIAEALNGFVETMNTGRPVGALVGGAFGGQMAVPDRPRVEVPSNMKSRSLGVDSATGEPAYIMERTQ